jgi:hypothetical protein
LIKKSLMITCLYISCIVCIVKHFFFYSNDLFSFNLYIIYINLNERIFKWNFFLNIYYCLIYKRVELYPSNYVLTTEEKFTVFINFN